MIYALADYTPDFKSALYIDPTATIIGNVIRADFAPIIIGINSNVQDNVSIHVDLDLPCDIGANVSIGHNAILHSCCIDDNVIIGMGSVILNNTKIAKNCIIGAGSLVTQKLPYEEGGFDYGLPCPNRT
ncbi:gamma carbonic anhydrase family protein [Orbus mooreae]|uniref:gamma carbonic anhydrase family protein n=1 Tax=Orbus mooreae TaxID=3074107 RepID=UPI00370D2AC6